MSPKDFKKGLAYLIYSCDNTELIAAWECVGKEMYCLYDSTDRNFTNCTCHIDSFVSADWKELPLEEAKAYIL